MQWANDYTNRISRGVQEDWGLILVFQRLRRTTSTRSWLPRVSGPETSIADGDRCCRQLCRGMRLRKQRAHEGTIEGRKHHRSRPPLLTCRSEAGGRKHISSASFCTLRSVNSPYALRFIAHAVRTYLITHSASLPELGKAEGCHPCRRVVAGMASAPAPAHNPKGGGGGACLYARPPSVESQCCCSNVETLIGWGTPGRIERESREYDPLSESGSSPEARLLLKCLLLLRPQSAR